MLQHVHACAGPKQQTKALAGGESKRPREKGGYHSACAPPGSSAWVWAEGATKGGEWMRAHGGTAAAILFLRHNGGE